MEREPYWQQLDLAWYMLEVGDEVEVLRDIYEGANDHSPGGFYARAGEKVIIKGKADYAEMFKWPYLITMPFTVAHEHVTDGSSFRVNFNEIGPWLGYSPIKKAQEIKDAQDREMYGCTFKEMLYGVRY